MRDNQYPNINVISIGTICTGVYFHPAEHDSVCTVITPGIGDMSLETPKSFLNC